MLIILTEDQPKLKQRRRKKVLITEVELLSVE